MRYFLFDIGGTKTRVAMANGKGIIGTPIIARTPQHFRDGVLLVSVLAKKLMKGKKLGAIAGGAPGPFDVKKGTLLRSPNLPLWIEKPLKRDLEKLLNAPVLLENDANLAGLGEAVYGAGRGSRIVAYLTISTGVGGVRIVDGKIDAYSYGQGMEPGHQIIDMQGGSLENYISGAALLRRYKKKPEAIHDRRVWEKEAELLAYGLHNTIVHWSPDVVVLGGGLMRRGGISLHRVRFHLKKHLHIFPHLPRIVRGVLGDRAGLHGALTLLLRRVSLKRVLSM